MIIIQALIAVALIASIFALIVFWVMALVSAIKRKDLKSDRLIWILVIIFTGVIGSTIYFFMEDRKKLGWASVIMAALFPLALLFLVISAPVSASR
jgi:hypothetical protein